MPPFPHFGNHPQNTTIHFAGSLSLARVGFGISPAIADYGCGRARPWVANVAVSAPFAFPVWEPTFPSPAGLTLRVSETSSDMKPVIATAGPLIIREHEMETIAVNGRVAKSVWLKIIPIWWFGSDEQQLSEAPWYRPEWPQWRRYLYWYYLRNPFQNFRKYVLGVADKNYWVTGRAPALTIQRDDLRPVEYGFQWAVLYGGDLRIPRLFLSYSGRRIVWQFGVQPNGFFGLKFNVHVG